jgi:exodeoxyribonuclease V alpha subunit
MWRRFMTDLKSLRQIARAEGAEWYQIYLAEKLTQDFKGDEELYQLLLSILIQNDGGHLRIKLKKDQAELLEKYSPLVHGDNSPFYINREGHYIYTRKRWEQENLFISLLEKSLNEKSEPLSDIFTENPEERENQGDQQLIISLAKKINRNRIFIITGGPGTGKTTIVANLIKLIRSQEENTGQTPLKISLAAPTGRAAKRVEQSLGKLAEGEPAQTLHKLLGINYKTGEPRYHKNNPLPSDLIIVDEASMVDLRMMTLLFDGLSVKGHLLLVGDRDQLPSVEAGALLSDFLFDIEKKEHKLHDRVLILDHVYRSNRIIIDLARSVIEGRENDVFSILRKSHPEVAYEPIPARADHFYKKISLLYREERPEGMMEDTAFESDIRNWEKNREQIESWFEYYSRIILLSPARKGLFGTDRINREIRSYLNPVSQHGIPIMMTRNDYDLDLFNGDRGIIFSFKGEYHAFFPDPYRFYPLAYLSEWEYSWVQTIHKSQGSEYNHVQLVIPPGVERLLSREILYTGLTRARDKVTLYSQDGIIKTCLKNYVIRNSRIREVLLSVPLPA